MIRERRKRTRVPVVFDIKIIFKRKSIKVKTYNISLTGISCDSDPRLITGELCEVVFNLNPETKLRIEGKILRVDQKETIISFSSMDEDTFFHLKMLLQHNAADPDRIEKELKKPAFS